MKNAATAVTGIASLMALGACICLVSIWPYNLYKLTQCNWDNDNWKPEIIHGIGVVLPPASIVTVWFGTDAKGGLTIKAGK